MTRPSPPDPDVRSDAAPAARDPVVRPARPGDLPDVERILSSLDLDYPGRDLSAFRVLESGGRVVGVAEVRPIPGGSLLGCVGVEESQQGAGLGRTLVEGALAGAPGDVWLYTLIPDFFGKLGFEVAPDRARGVPARWLYNCRACEPERCRAMVRRGGAAP
jgi:N-acetylglutamate synthase-like GNAT family acetyltransferase